VTSQRGLGPGGLIGILVGVGLFAGNTGQLVLRRLKRLVGWGILAAVVVTVLLLLFALLAPSKEAGVYFAFSLMGVFLLAVTWCFIAFAAWLTRPANTVVDDGQRWLPPEPADKPARYVPPRRMQWYELLGVHPDDGREEIVAALEREAREGETWYEAIDVSPYATRREIVDALRREFEHAVDAIDEEIGEVVREEYGRPTRRR